jgi:preprotein translocase subunit SecG
METVLLVIHLILAILLIVAVLMQRSEGGGLGIGGGGGGGGNVGGFMSVRGTANFLTRATAVIAACFMLTSLTLAILAGNQNTSKSVLDRPGAAETQNQEPKEGQVPLSR